MHLLSRLLIVGVGFTLQSAISYVVADLELDVEFLERAYEGMRLTAITYFDEPNGTAYEEFQFFTNSADRAIVAKTNGHCYAAFQPTTVGGGDIISIFQLGRVDVCKDGGSACCQVRRPFWNSWNNDFRVELEDALRSCVANTCPDPVDCVVFAGSSGGAAVAVVAAMDLDDLNPEVHAAGMPKTVGSGCDAFATSNIYRYVNSREKDNGSVVYDPVPFLPGLAFSVHYGHLILLSDDVSGAASIGLDNRQQFRPFDLTLSAHWLKLYKDRLEESLDYHRDNGLTLWRTTGYSVGTGCTVDEECDSGRCDEVCL